MQNPFLVGDKIYLRPFEMSDAPKMAPWINDYEVTRNLRIHRPMSTKHEEDFVAHVHKLEHDVTLAMVVKEGDKLIGSVGLHNVDVTNRHCMFGIVIGEKALWGKGYGTEGTRMMTMYAFETLNMNRVWLHVYEFNARGMKAYEKVGYKKEGLLRQHVYREGRYWDVVSMGILRTDWDEQKKKIPAF